MLKRLPKDPRKRVLRSAEEIATQPEVEQSDEITRIGVVWAGILDLDDVIPPTTVAAMLSASELVQATSTKDGEEHWIGAAVYAAMGAYNEPDYDDEDDGKLTTSEGTITMGFAPPNHSKE